jgi:hypothetical protein
MNRIDELESIIISLLVKKYEKEDINVDLVLKIEKESNRLYEEVTAKLNKESGNSSFIPPRF